MEVCTEEVYTLLCVTIPKYICFQVQYVRVTIKETGNKPLAFKNCKLFCSYASLHHHPHQKISPENFKVQEQEKHNSPTLNQASDYKCFLDVL